LLKWIRVDIIAKRMAVISVLLLLLAAELSLRAYHQHRMRVALPTELRAETRKLTWKAIQDKYRIVCFGDSITFGEHLPYAQAYPAVLEDLLREKHPDLDAVVINAGIRGHTSVQGLGRLERDVLWYEPHVVLTAYGINDGNLGYWPLDPIRERHICGDSSLQGHILPLLRRSHLWLTLRGRARRLLRRLGWQERPAVISKEGEPKPRVSQRGFEIAQEHLATRIQRDGWTTLFLMTTTPVAEAFHSDGGPAQHERQLAIYDEYNRVIREVATKHSAYLLDLREIFADYRQTELSSLLAEDGVHLTAAGERLVALSTLQALEESGLPGSDPYQRR
jgi:lysophospholipase L1-like esterase